MIFERQHVGVIREKHLEPILVACIRWKGRYSDTGRYFGKLFRSMGANAKGKAFNLYYEDEYVEREAEVESCIEIRKRKEASGVVVRTLDGGRAFTLVHKGPYEGLTGSYETLFAHIEKQGLRPLLPVREVYIKGPGMLFRGNPKNYLTELQVLVGE